MALALVVDAVDAVPEVHRGLYVEKEGRFHLDVTGVEDVSGLKSSLQKEREAVREANRQRKELEERFNSTDARLREITSKLDNDGEAKLIAEGKLDQVIANRTSKLKEDTQKQIDAAKAETKAAQARAKKFEQNVLDNQIRAAALTAGVHKSAIDDALFRGRNLFSLDSDDRAVQLDSDGNPVLGKDGKTPFTPGEWIEAMKETAPHWFPADASGGGATGNKETRSGEKVIKRAAWNALDTNAKKDILKTHRIQD